MVKFTLFPSAKKSSPGSGPPANINLDKYKEIAYRMLKAGKTENEVAAYLKSQGLSYEQIDNILNTLIKSAALSTPPSISSTNPPQATQPRKLPQAPITKQQQSAQVDLSSLIDSILDKLLVEIEEIVDLIIEKKYGNLKKEIKDLHTLKENIEKIDKKIEEEISAFKSEITSKIEETNKTLASLKEAIDNMEPRLNALENAFKDTIPNIIDDLRKIEERYSLQEEKKEDVLLSKKEENKEEDKKEEHPLKEFKLDDLIN